MRVQIRISHALLLRPLLDRQRTAWAILNLFGETRKTHDAFWERFAELTPEDRAFLARFYETETPWALFSKICVFWAVPCTLGIDKGELCKSSQPLFRSAHAKAPGP